MISFRRQATVRPWLGLLLALASLVLVSGVQANNKGNKVPGNGANKPAPQGMTHQQLINELHSTRTLLQNADHDYDGHRAKAVHHVGAAIHALGGHHHTQAGGTTTPAVNPQPVNAQGGKNPLPQEVSDARLKQGIQQLQIIQQQLATTKPGKNHGNAATSIQNAITELNTALKIK
jgi:hypothetical protein